MQNFDTILSGFGLVTSDEASAVLQRGVEVQALRGRTPPLSRSSLFLACVESSDPLLDAVSIAGFKLDAYINALALSSVLPPSDTLHENVVINDYIIAALSTYAINWKDRPIDALALGAMILETPSEEFKAYLETAGLPASVAKGCSASLFASMQRAPNFDRPRPATWQPNTIENW